MLFRSSECRKVLTLAKAGRKNGCLIEGMGCPGGCIAGAGTNIPLNQATVAVRNFKGATKQAIPDIAILEDNDLGIEIQKPEA